MLVFELVKTWNFPSIGNFEVSEHVLYCFGRKGGNFEMLRNGNSKKLILKTLKCFILEFLKQNFEILESFWNLKLF